MRVRRLTLIVASTTLLVLLVGSPETLRAEESLEDRIEGTFEAAESPKKERKRLDKKVEGIVEQMSFYKRPFARGELRDATDPAQKLSISFDGEKVEIQFDDDPPAVSKKDGTPGTWTNTEGEAHELKQTVGANRIVQSFTNDEGTRKNTFSLEDDDTLVMQVEIDSSQMPEPLTYRRTFRRAD